MRVITYSYLSVTWLEEISSFNMRVIPLCICAPKKHQGVKWIRGHYILQRCVPFICITTLMTSSNENIFRVTGPLCGEFTGHRWIPLTKASDAELWCFLWSAPWINGWVNNREAGHLRRHRTHYNVIVMTCAGNQVLQMVHNVHPVQELQNNPFVLVCFFVVIIWTSIEIQVGHRPLGV